MYTKGHQNMYPKHPGKLFIDIQGLKVRTSVCTGAIQEQAVALCAAIKSMKPLTQLKTPICIALGVGDKNGTMPSPSLR